MVYRGYIIEQFGDQWTIANLRRVVLCETSSYEEAVAMIDNAHQVDEHTKRSQTSSQS